MSKRVEENGHRRSRLAVAEPDGLPAQDRGGTRVAIGIRGLGFHQEVQDFLGRDPRFDIVAAAVDADRLVSLLEARSPDVVLVCPTVGRELRHPALGDRRPPIVIVAEDMTVPVLRDAIDAGAHSVFSWPEERDELARSVARLRARELTPGTDRGRVIAVHGARGGAGATFVATHLAGALARRGLKTVLVDVDMALSDLSTALGVEPGDQVRTVLDLVPVMGELSHEHIEDALFRHARGFSVLLPPSEPGIGQVRPGLVRAAIALLAGAHDAVVVHLPRAVDRVARAGLDLADMVLIITTLDLFSVYGARRVMERLGAEVDREQWRVVVNKPAKSALSGRDLERILGLPITASVRFDPRVRRAQGRGELVPDRAGGVGRDIRRLARLVMEHRPSSRSDEGA